MGRLRHFLLHRVQFEIVHDERGRDHGNLRRKSAAAEDGERRAVFHVFQLDVVVAYRNYVLERFAGEPAEAKSADEFLVAVGKHFVGENRRADGVRRTLRRRNNTPCLLDGGGGGEIHLANDDAIGLAARLAKIDELLLEIGRGSGFGGSSRRDCSAWASRRRSCRAVGRGRWTRSIP